MALDRTTYHSYLMDYASGALDEAHALLIATHLSLSPHARKIVAQYESVGGGLLSDCCDPVDMCKEALSNVLNRLDDCQEEKCKELHARLGCPEGKKLPLCLQEYMSAREHLSWKQQEPGLETVHVTTKTCGAKASLLRVGAGVSLSPMHIKGYDLLLVLDGGFIEEDTHYHRGDIRPRGALQSVTIQTDPHKCHT